MQVNLHDSTAPQSTTSFTTGAQPFTPAGSASTIMSQAEKPKEKSFLTTVADFVTSIPGKIWGFVQWLFCCNSTPVTVAGFLDNPDGFMKALAKDPVKGTEQLVDSLLSDPAQLVPLFKMLSNSEAQAALQAKSSMSHKEKVALTETIRKAIMSNVQPRDVTAAKVRMEELPMRLIPQLANGVLDILDLIARAVHEASECAEQQLLLAFLDKSLPTLRIFVDGLPDLTQEEQRLEAQLAEAAKTGNSLAVGQLQDQLIHHHAQCTLDAQKAVLGIEANMEVDTAVLARRLQTFLAETLPLLMGVITGAMSTPTQEVIPGVQLDLKEKVAGILGEALGVTVLEFTEPLKAKMPIANVVHTRIEAFLKEERKVAAFVTALLNGFMPSAK